MSKSAFLGVFLVAGAGIGLWLAFRRAPAPPISESPDAGIERELEGIRALEKAAPDFSNAGEVTQRYADFMKKHERKKGELEAHALLEDYRRRCEAVAWPAFEALKKREQELGEEARLAERLRVYKEFPAGFLSCTQAGAKVQVKIAELRRRIGEAWEQNRDKASKLLKEDKFGEALGALRSMEREGIAGEASDLLRLKRQAEAGLRRELEDRYLKVDGAFKEAMAARDPRRAAEVVAGFLFGPWSEEEGAFIRVDGPDYGALKKAIEEWRPADVVELCEAHLADAEGRAGPAVGEMVLLDLRSAGLVELFYRDAAREGPGDLKTLWEDELALRAGKAGSTAARIGFFYYYSGKNLYEKAYEHLILAQAQGTKGLRMYLSNLVGAAHLELDRTLAAKFGAAQEYVRRKQWGPARRLLDEVVKYPEHPFTAKNRPAIESLADDVSRGEEGDRALANQYRGRIERVDASTLRVTYDFRDAGQLEAFEPEDAARIKGRWKIQDDALESSPETSAVRWKFSLKGDVAVEYDLTPLKEPQNIVLDLFYHKGQNRHYAVVVGFDWIGKTEGDVDDSAEDRFGMPRTCVIKHPVKADRTAWRNPAEWENWKRRVVGKAVEDWKPGRGESARVKVVRRGKRIDLYARRRLIWEGEDAEYTEGDLLFFSDGPCRIDNLSITFTP